MNILLRFLGLTNNSPSKSEQQGRAPGSEPELARESESELAPESEHLRLVDDILRSQLRVCHDNIPVAWLLSRSASRQLLELHKRDLSAAKYGCADDVIKEEVATPNVVEIRDSAGDSHLDLDLSLPEDGNVNVAPASTSSAGVSVPNTSLMPPLPPPREENIGPDKLVQWRSYECSFQNIPYLDDIFHKHPKTFEAFKVKSAHFQATFLDALASLIKSLAGKRISQITTNDINVARDLMMDWKSMAGLDLSWLEQRYADANARLAVHGLNQESAQILLELQHSDKYVMDLRRDLVVEEAKAASLRARCEELAENISSQQALIDPTLSFEDEILKDLLTEHSHPENFNSTLSN